MPPSITSATAGFQAVGALWWDGQTLTLLAPFIYLVFGHLSVAIGCLIYNFMFRYIGGIEFEAKNEVDVQG